MAERNPSAVKRVGNTRLVPLYSKIVVLFVFFLLVSNFSTNYINLILNRSNQIQLMNQLLLKELKENYVFAGTQFDVYSYDQNLLNSQNVMAQAAVKNLIRTNSLAFAVKQDGSMLYFASPNLKWTSFQDSVCLSRLNAARLYNSNEGPLEFTVGDNHFFGYYKYNTGWQAYLVRAEDKDVFLADSWGVFASVGGLILLITLITAILGILLLRHLFRFVDRITYALMEMQKTQELAIIDMSGAPNDDITYLGLSFNNLSVTIRNLMNIFRKFVTQDVAYKAYREHKILLEGTKQDLTILFTDIKGFTYMTETLGNDIIKLLNLHYDQAIRHIQEEDGIVGSIIGDALLAVFGTIEGAKDGRSLKSIDAAYKIQAVAETLRGQMRKKYKEIIDERQKLTPEEERVFKAVLIEVGVGIDGGEVFYGNIGSYVRMTNTVIGDNVNSASRLEGLTRIYKVPVIVSEYVKDEVLDATNKYEFIELDLVQVKGKTEGKKIFYPIERSKLDPAAIQRFDLFSQALQAYYQGDWRKAENGFKDCGMELGKVFLERITGAQPPEGWNGIWTMTSK